MHTNATLAQQIAAFIDSGGVFALPHDAFGAGGIQQLLDGPFAAALRLTSASITQPSGSGVAVSGKSTLFSGDALDATATFTTDGNTVSLNLAVAMPAGWKPSTAFPAYAGGPLDKVGLSSPRFLLSSAGDTAAGLSAGMNFAATLDLAALNALSGLLGHHLFAVTGPVTMVQGIPEMTLSVPLAETHLGGLVLPLMLQVISAVVPGVDGGATWVTTYFKLVSNLSFTAGGKNVVLPLSTAFNLGTSGPLVFDADISGLVSCGLSELSGVVKDVNFAGILPATFQPSGVGLYDLRLTVQTSPLALASIKLGVLCDTSWSLLPDLSIDSISIDFTVLNPAGPRRQVLCVVTGVFTLEGAEIDLTASIPPPTFSGSLKDGDTLDLKAFLAHYLPAADLPSLTIAQLDTTVAPGRNYAFSTRMADVWSIPLGPTNLNISDVALAINRDSTTTPATTTGFVGGTLAIGSVQLSVHYALPGQFKVVGRVDCFSLASAVNTLGGGHYSYPSSLPDLSLNQTVLEISKTGQDYRLVFGTSVSDFGTVEVMVAKSAAAGWGFAAGFVLPPDWKLSRIPHIPSTLDGLVFSNSALIASSIADPALTIPNLTLPSGGPGLSHGVNFFASLHLQGNGMDALATSFKVPVMDLHAVIDDYPANIELDATLRGSLAVSSTVSFTDFGLTIKPGGSLPSIDLHASCQVKLHDQTLTFRGDVAITPAMIEFSLGLVGAWQPFGTNALTVRDTFISLKIGAALALGLRGEIDFGTTQVKVAADVVAEGEAVAVDLIYGELVGTVSLTQVVNLVYPNGIPPEAAQFLAVSLSNFEIDMVTNPMGVTIAGLTYPPGFRIKGTLLAYGVTAAIDVAVDSKDPGIKATGSLSRVQFGDILKIDGVDLKLILRVKDPLNGVFSFKGSGDILGITIALEVFLSRDHFTFRFSEKIFHAFQAEVQASASLGGVNKADFYLMVDLKDDLLTYLTANASRAIKQVSDDANAKISSAQAAVNDAKKEVDGLNDTIAQVRKQIAQQTASAQSGIRDAQNQVNDARNKVNSLQREIDDKTHELTNLGWKDFYKGAWLSPEIAGLEVAMRTAQGALLVARGVLKAAQGGTQIYPADLDPRIIALQASLKVAQGTLDVANLALLAAKDIVGGVLSASNYIVQHGLAALLIVREAKFEGQLSAVNGGSVKLSLTLNYQGNAQTVSLDFNFKSPMDGAKALAQKLIKSF